jgi:hypothetical protein
VYGRWTGELLSLRAGLDLLSTVIEPGSRLRSDPWSVYARLRKQISCCRVSLIFHQGLYTFEESLWLQNGRIFTKGPGAYKIPTFADVPQEFNVWLHKDSDFAGLRTIHVRSLCSEDNL